MCVGKINSEGRSSESKDFIKETKMADLPSFSVYVHRHQQIPASKLIQNEPIDPKGPDMIHLHYVDVRGLFRRLIYFIT